MTEQEAKTTWCPFARGITDNGGNRMAYGGATPEPGERDCYDEYAAEMANLYPCIGSACMAWRWLPGWDGKRVEEMEVSDHRELPDRPGFVWHLENVLGAKLMGIPPAAPGKVRYGLFARIGYCGPAGKP